MSTPIAASNEGVISHPTDGFGRGPGGPVVAEAGATTRRSNDGVPATVEMPTPESGSDGYPDPEVDDTPSDPGRPEGVTLRVFVFDDPEDDDFTGESPGAGHLVGGDTLTPSGHLSTNAEPLVGERLKRARGAAAHLAVAPRGGVDDVTTLEPLETPGGGPEHRWFARFEPDSNP